MIVLKTNRFSTAAKKLRKNQLDDLDGAVREIASRPDIGTSKVGDLAGVRVHKFRMLGQETLLAYTYDETGQTPTEEGSVPVVTLLDVGSHQNFYRDLKKAK